MPFGGLTHVGPRNRVFDGVKLPMGRSIFEMDMRLPCPGWLHGTAVERRSFAGELSMSCARPVADG